jgi:hypothetical protein
MSRIVGSHSLAIFFGRVAMSGGRRPRFDSTAERASPEFF